MLVDQEPNRVQTQSLSMVLNRLSPRSLETATNFTDDPSVGEFKFAFSAITDEKARDAEYIDSVVTKSRFSTCFEFLNLDGLLQRFLKIIGTFPIS